VRAVDTSRDHAFESHIFHSLVVGWLRLLVSPESVRRVDGIAHHSASTAARQVPAPVDLAQRIAFGVSRNCDGRRIEESRRTGHGPPLQGRDARRPKISLAKFAGFRVRLARGRYSRRADSPREEWVTSPTDFVKRAGSNRMQSSQRRRKSTLEKTHYSKLGAHSLDARKSSGVRRTGEADGSKNSAGKDCSGRRRAGYS
jgi:hypothetical protein